MTAPQIAEFFDSQAERYDSAYDASGPGGYVLRTRFDAALDLVGDGPGSVLDVGMGGGRLCAELERRGWTVSGVDAAEQMVDLARARLPRARERLVQASADDLPFPSGAFDVVVATGVLEYLPAPGSAIREAARVLRPGGRAVFSLPNAASFYGAWKRILVYPAVRLLKRLRRDSRPARPFTVWPPARRRLEALLSEAGLRVDSVDYVAFLAVPPPFDDLLPNATVRLSERLERSGHGVRSLLATQLVFHANKPEWKDVDR